MKIKIEKGHNDICNKLVSDVNKLSRRFSLSRYKSSAKKDRTLLSRDDISVEKKKKELKNRLYELITKTFSIDLGKVNDKRAILEELKKNLDTLREIVIKIRSLNHYISEVLLSELGLTKKLDIRRLGESANEEELKKKDIDKLEHLVYNMIKRIMVLDQKLLRRYKEQEDKIIEDTKVETKDIDRILRKETDILCHLEAKLPPASKTKRILLKKGVFTEWVARIFALISAFESEYEKEEAIFKKLKENSKIKKRVETKIRHLVREKWYLLKLKEERLLSMENIGKLEEEYYRLSHNYASTISL